MRAPGAATGSRLPRTLFQDCVSHRRPHDCRGGSSGGPADNPHRSKPSGFIAFHRDRPRPSASDRDRPRPTTTDRVRPPSSLHIPVHLKGFSIGGEGIVSRLIIRDRPRPTATVRVRPRPTATDRVRPRPTARDRPRPTARDRPRPTASDRDRPRPPATDRDRPRPTANIIAYSCAPKGF